MGVLLFFFFSKKAELKWKNVCYKFVISRRTNFSIMVLYHGSKSMMSFLYLYVKFDFDSINCFVVLVAPSPIHVANIHLYENELNIKSGG